MDAGWLEFLRGTDPPEHAAQVYRSVDELAASVAGFLAAGFAAGEPALVIATPEHWEVFAAHLAGCGWDAERALDDGLLQVADAAATLAGFMSGTAPDAGRFAQVVGTLVAETESRFPETTIRAFGEMVDLLARRGQYAAAAAVEELWNDLSRRHRFSLLCGYHRGVEEDGALGEVCRIHSRVLLA